MSKNIIFVFTGTGNSLKAAKVIAKELEDCRIVSMGSCTEYDLAAGYESIGFVFPNYYGGEPRKVREFITKLNLQQNKNAYYYAVPTCGRYGGNVLNHTRKFLKRKGLTLQYGKMLDTYSNYVVMYNMLDTVEEENKQSEQDLAPILQAIKHKEMNKIPGMNPIMEILYRIYIRRAPKMDQYYSVSNDCIKCGICEKVCPVGNIGMDRDGRPYFEHHCEQCVACIQFCPKRAINYKNVTQGRKRYTNPAFKYTDLAKLNGKVIG